MEKEIKQLKVEVTKRLFAIHKTKFGGDEAIMFILLYFPAFLSVTL